MATYGLAMGLLLTGCGGGAADPLPANGCTLSNQAGCGGSGVIPPVNPPVTPPVTPPVIPPVVPADLASVVSLLFDATEIKSAGGEIGITALVTNAANSALPGAAISFSANSGVLSGADSVTDKNGRARVLLGSGASNANRSIKILAKVGDKSATGSVDVVGTSVVIDGPVALRLGQSADLNITLRDSASRPIAGATLAFSSQNGNPLSAKNSTLTNAQGKVTLSLQAARLGADAVSVSALGASASIALAIAGTDLSITPAVGSDANGAERLMEVATGACQAVDVRYEKLGAGQSGTVSLSTSRGILYSDVLCSQPLNGALALHQGDLPRSFVKSANAGIATLSAAVAGGPVAHTRIEFVAPLTASARLSLQAEPAILASNSATAATERSVLSAVVRDGSAASNLVKGAGIDFAIILDPSGGYLQQPSGASSGSDGAAQAVYIAGPADSGKDGVLIEARIAGINSSQAIARTRLTVAKKALSIQFGTGNSATEYSNTLLQKEFAVLVSDAAGNAVPGVSISAAAWPASYRKGRFIWQADQAAAPDVGVWLAAAPVYTCANEDVLRNGIYDPAYDINGNGVLDPGIPITISNGGQTNALGLSTVTLNYPRSHGYWVQVELTVRGSVAGTEAVSSTRLTLPTLAKDFSDRRVAPPGRISPYGEGACNHPD
ncbi:bacterial Ig-like domain family protein [Janthinobacterium agaricidamnosum NBRC 102515 = DSM 9628]|uniref:Bacterial Ig-like domain family protein n=2 Tax=Janthinobacterium agaricidamnosum TaxID=55508 RepID=W0V7T8_9BURK|nr:bacterial Ig-like domain family protein [Janthinobacterium agaricidamnosum NBRC 102515 = DSM 9628]